jgi:glucokinase
MDQIPMSEASRTSQPYRYAIGVDRGATNIRVGLVRSDGKVLKLNKKKKLLLSMQDLANAAEQLISPIQELLHQPEVSGLNLDGIVVSMAGVINREGQIVDSAFPPDPNWRPVDLQAMLRTEFGGDLVVLVENDSKAAAWGEYVFGAGRGSRNMVCITVGSGIGGGLILNGELFHGNAGYAGLLGFISVDRNGERCPCGLLGCVNDYACGIAIANNAKHLIQQGGESILSKTSGGDCENITSELVFEAARAGDDLAQGVIWGAADALAITVASLLHTLNPDVVVIGGGIAQQGDFYLDRIRKTTVENSMRCYRSTPIILAELGNLAGTIGAAALLWPSSNRSN